MRSHIHKMRSLNHNIQTKYYTPTVKVSINHPWRFLRRSFYRKRDAEAYMVRFLHRFHRRYYLQ